MPFTLAHPAIILPLTRIPKYFNTTALVIGSVAPDFEYFFRFQATSTISHTILGIFIFNLPLVFLLSVIFHNLIKTPFIKHLPKPLDRFYIHLIETKFQLNSLKKLVIFVLSAIIGTASHILWDSFTHVHGYFVELIPSLQSEILSTIPIYKMLQHGSTVVGLTVLILFCLSKTGKTNQYAQVSTEQTQLYWIHIISITFAITSVWSAYQNVIQWYELVVPLISSFLIGLFFTSLIFREKGEI